MILSIYNYVITITILLIGLLTIVTNNNLVKKLFGLSIFQTAVLLFYISIGFIKNASIPIISAQAKVYHNPLPHVLMLTAIVVGVATLATGLSLVIRIKEKYNSIERNETEN